MSQSPSVGRIVHYVSYGTPARADGTQDYTSECRAAIVTQVWRSTSTTGVPTGAVGLAVLNPTGMFFHERCRHDEDGKAGGTWHWPERV